MYKYHFGISNIEFGKVHPSSDCRIRKLHIRFPNYKCALSLGPFRRIQFSDAHSLRRDYSAGACRDALAFQDCTSMISVGGPKAGNGGAVPASMLCVYP